MVPGIVYGGTSDNIPVTVDPKDLLRLLRSHAGRNTILTLDIEGKTSDSVILKDWQVDPVSEDILHADFQRIAMDEALRVAIPIVLRGMAYGVKTEGGLLDAVVREIEVECLPADIPDAIECDVTELRLHDSIRVRDLPMIERVQIMDPPDQVIVHVVAVKEEVPEVEEVEDEEAEAALPVEGEAEPEVMSKGKKDEEGD